MRDPRLNTGQPGNAPLPDGYSIRNIRYIHVGPSKDDHEFTFDIYGPSGRVLSDVVYRGNNKTPWEGRISQTIVEGNKLSFVFSGWSNNGSTFHYIWE